MVLQVKFKAVSFQVMMMESALEHARDSTSGEEENARDKERLLRFGVVLHNKAQDEGHNSRE